jgi:hypothetical protein
VPELSWTLGSIDRYETIPSSFYISSLLWRWRYAALFSSISALPAHITGAPSDSTEYIRPH